MPTQATFTRTFSYVLRGRPNSERIQFVEEKLHGIMLAWLEDNGCERVPGSKMLAESGMVAYTAPDGTPAHGTEVRLTVLCRWDDHGEWPSVRAALEEDGLLPVFPEPTASQIHAHTGLPSPPDGPRGPDGARGPAGVSPPRSARAPEVWVGTLQPSEPATGDIWHDSPNERSYVWTGTEWVLLSAEPPTGDPMSTDALAEAERHWAMKGWLHEHRRATAGVDYSATSLSDGDSIEVTFTHRLTAD